MDETVKQRLNEITTQLEVECLVGDFKAFHKTDIDQILEILLKQNSF